MRKQMGSFWWIALAVVLLIPTGIVLLDRPQEETTEIATEQETKDVSVIQVQTKKSYAYCLKESGERIAVYDAKTDLFLFETGIHVRDLPAAWRDTLREGYYVEDLDALYEFLENYTS
jgi:hypothetical protein